MQFGNATINMAKFSKLANRHGEEEATRQLREQYVRNPAEKAFLERQNDIGYNALDQGARVKFGGSFDHSFGSPNVNTAYGEATGGIEQSPALQGLFDATETNDRSAGIQNMRRRGLSGRQAEEWADYSRR